jgi:hypothetical protein
VATWKTGTVRKAGAIWEAVVINVLTDAAIKRWPYQESNPDYVLSCASLIFRSGYVAWNLK